MKQTAQFDGTFEAWWRATSDFLRRRTQPTDIYWPDPFQKEKGLFDGAQISAQPAPAIRRESRQSAAAASRTLVKGSPLVADTAWRRILALARRVCYARYPERFSLLYRVVWRMQHGEPHLTDLLTDADMRAVQQWDGAVRRDAHKAKAFVRFKLMHCDPITGLEHFAAWHCPSHYPLRLVGDFFADRFATMRWTIFTPDETANWDGQHVVYLQNRSQINKLQEDNIESLWLTYYSHIFNPARLNVKAMQREMPKHHWQTLPEAKILPDLIQSAASRSSAMQGHIDSPAALRKIAARRYRGGAETTPASPAAMDTNQTPFTPHPELENT